MTQQNSTTAPAQDLCAGIDVAKDKLDVCIGSSTLFVAENNETGWAEITTRLLQAGTLRVAMEATGGGLHLAVARALAGAGIAVDIAHPLCVRRFAQARRAVSAKTDRADARVLSAYAASHLCRPRAVPTADEQALRECQSRRRQLVDERANELKRAQQCTAARVKASIERHIDSLGELIAELEEEITRLIDGNERLQRLKALLMTAPGVGAETAHSLLVNLPELGKLKRGAIASLAGLAPYQRESGGWTGEAHIAGGREPVRRTLYMAIQGALRAKADSPMKDIYKRVHDRNTEARKKAHIAAARKLLTILNAMVKGNKEYDPEFGSKGKKGGKPGDAA